MAFRLTDFLSAAEKTMLCLLCFSYDSCCFKAAKCPPELFRKNPPVSIRRESVRRGSVRRGSARRGSVRRGSVRRGSVRRGSVRRGSARRESVRRGSVRRKKALREKAAGQTGLNRPFFSVKNRKRYFCLLYPRREAAAVSSRKMQLGWFCRTEAGHMGVTSPFTAFLTASAFDAPVAIRTIFFAFIMDCMPIVSA